ncbi:hypothetical protein SAMN02787118_13621 [Streptomyces mirabilis]|uniref:Hsp70 protein n=1 Tax=Streptomyces mirabilis TaxID=68239 RepID=A0A1I2WA56_9ACTN|nr:hypothetical protein SAMN02787118_13621 [Streptomyces mirabilis]
MDYGRAALNGAASGALPGALIGWIFGLLNWLDPVVGGLVLALYGLNFGAVVGALLGMVFDVAQHGHRDFASVRSVMPSRDEVVTDADVADEAARLLAKRSDREHIAALTFPCGPSPPADHRERSFLMAKAVGIDLGTTNSVIAVWEGGEARVSPMPRAAGPRPR